VHAAASEVSVVPITRVDLNIVGGIIRAIQEQRISTVVIGWQGGSAARAFIFGSVIDQLLEDTREMIVMSKIERRLSTHQRLVLAVPPFAERESGFADAMRAIKILCDRAGMDLVILTPEHAAAALMRRVEAVRPKVPVDVETIPRWAHLVERLDGLIEPTDVIALLSEREGSVAWRPSLNRLPGVIAQRFADATFLTIYMSEQPFSEILEGGVDRLEPEALRAGLRLEDITLGVQEGGLDAVLQQVMRPLIEEHPEAASQVIETLQDVRGGYAPELRPGVALYHVHADRLDATRLFVGISADGVRLPGVSQPAHVVIVMVGANALDPEAYLQRLSVVTELVPSDESVEALRQCSEAEAVRELLIRDLREASIASG
jgi:mannitol/fructose-specific phosphotransferase system IIA component (Ntr-type)